MLYYKYKRKDDMRNRLNVELMLEELTNHDMLDQMLTDKIIHDFTLYGSYEWKWSKWIRTN